jgi:UDP-N-acetylmuramoyl-tripeptide--D-alanyl-D-alanine ligase
MIGTAARPPRAARFPAGGIQYNWHAAPGGERLEGATTPGWTMIELEDVLAGTGGRLYGAASTAVSFGQVRIDSRAIEPGDLFVAVHGEVQDGHRFVPDAFARGARAAIVQRGRAAEFAVAASPTDAAPTLLIEVQEPLAALGALAAYWHTKFPVPVIGITGSIGKSSTKELLSGVLGTRRRVLKSPKSYNNEYGLPLSMLLIGPDTDIAVLEMGTFGPGELASLAAIAHPSIAIVTNVGHTHLERMGSQDGIARAKGELVAALPPDGVAVLNGDDPRVRAMATLTAARALIYGYGESCDLRASAVTDHGLAGLSFTLSWADQSVRLDHAPLLGVHSVYTALAAAGAALAAGLTLEEVAAGLRQPHAATRLVLTPAINGATIIDDSYNSAPASALAALGILAQTPAKRRLAVLGDMLELGSYEAEGHQLVGREVAKVADTLLTIGPRARLIAAEARARGLGDEQIRQFERKDEITQALREELREGDVVLIKGSRGLALEDVVAALREVR